MSDSVWIAVIIAGVVVFVLGAFILASRLFGPKKQSASAGAKKPAVRAAANNQDGGSVMQQTYPVMPPAAQLPDPRAYAGQLPDVEYSRQLTPREPQPAPGRISYGKATGYVDMSARMPAAQQPPFRSAVPNGAQPFPFGGGSGKAAVMRLTITDDNGAPAYFVDITEKELPVTIGRGLSDAKGRSIVVNEPTVSSLHARIGVKNGVLYVSDCCSTCGTVVTAHGGSVVLKGERKEASTHIYAGSFELALGKMGVRAELVGDYRATVLTGCMITLSASCNGMPVAQGAYCSSFAIGRQDADFNLADPRVSRLHARVTLTPDGQFILRDQNSTNGVFAASGEQISELPLQTGTSFIVGDTLVQVENVQRGLVPASCEQTRPRTVYYDSVANVRDPRFV